MDSSPATPWSFLANHALVLTYVGRHPESTGREVAQSIRISERAVTVGELLSLLWRDQDIPSGEFGAEK